MPMTVTSNMNPSGRRSRRQAIQPAIAEPIGAAVTAIPPLQKATSWSGRSA